MEKTRGEERQRVRARTFHINSPSVAFSVVERERGGDKLREQIARTIVCDISPSSGANKRETRKEIDVYRNVCITRRNFARSSKREVERVTELIKRN